MLPREAESEKGLCRMRSSGGKHVKKEVTWGKLKKRKLVWMIDIV